MLSLRAVLSAAAAPRTQGAIGVKWIVEAHAVQPSVLEDATGPPDARPATDTQLPGGEQPACHSRTARNNSGFRYFSLAQGGGMPTNAEGTNKPISL
jgi:hypothetical protein